MIYDPDNPNTWEIEVNPTRDAYGPLMRLEGIRELGLCPAIDQSGLPRNVFHRPGVYELAAQDGDLETWVSCIDCGKVFTCECPTDYFSEDPPER